MRLFQKFGPIENNLIVFQTIILFSIFSVYLSAEYLFGVTLRWILFCIFSVTSSVVYIVLLLKNKVNCRKKLYRIDLYIIFILLYTFIQIVSHVIQNNKQYEFVYLTAVSIITYFLFSAPVINHDKLFHLEYFDLYLAACMIIYAEILVRLLIFPNFEGFIGLLIRDADNMSAYLVLGTTVSIMSYCSNNIIKKDKLYLGMAAISFFLLASQKDLISILLISALFFIIPLFFLPTAELIKRNLIMAFLFFFILNNMPIITNYTNLLKFKLHYNILICIYLDVCSAIIGLMVFKYWDRIPKNVPPDKILLNRLQKAFAFGFKLFGILLAGMLCMGTLEGFEERREIGIISGYVNYLYEELRMVDGTFGQVLEIYGIIGVILLAMTYAVCLSHLKKRYIPNKKSAVLTIIAGMFLLQSFFFKQQIVTTPIYTVIMTFALFQEKNRKELFPNKALSSNLYKTITAHTD